MAASEWSLNEVKQMCGATNYSRGSSYYTAGRVRGLKVDEELDRYTAKVIGTHTYDVEISVDKAGDVEMNCTCPAFEDNWCCKHIAAVLIAVSKQQALSARRPSQQIPQTPQTPGPWLASLYAPPAAKPAYHLADRLIALAGELEDGETKVGENSGMSGEQGLRANDEKERLKFEYVFKMYNGRYQSQFLSVELRAGVKRTYVVYRISQFLEYLEANKSFAMTARFTFDPKNQLIHPADRKFLEILLLLKNSETMIKETDYYSSTADGRSLIVTPLAWERMKPLLPEVGAVLEGAAGPPVPMLPLQEAPKLGFTIDKDTKGNYRLLTSGLTGLTLLPDYSCLMAGGKLYQVDPSYLARIEPLVRQFDWRQPVPISPEQIEPFVQSAVPVLRMLGSVELAPAVRKRIQEPGLDAGLYVDYADETLSARLEFQYGSIVIDPLQDGKTWTEDDSILIRDARKEAFLLRALDGGSWNRTAAGWIAEGEKEVYEALFDLLPLLEEHASIFLTPAARRLVLEHKPAPRVRADLSSGLDLLEVSFEMEGFDSQEMVHVLQALVEKKRYIRLKSGTFLSLQDESFQEVQTVLDRLNLSKRELKSTSLQMPSIHALQLPQQGKSQKALRWGKSLKSFLQQLREPDSVEYAVPEQLEGVLRDYQVRGFQWLKTLSRFRFGGILADDMGLGKTIQSIAYICSELNEATEDRKQILILCPASLTYNWAEEFARFAPAVKVLVAAGMKTERSGLLEGAESGAADVIITSYPLLRRDSEFYEGKPFHAIILDEAQAIKNAASQTAQAVKTLTASRVFALTGTPIENSVDELGSIFSVVMPALFGRVPFRDVPTDRLSALVAPFILRRLKGDVLEELPDRIETVQRTELLDEQKKLYLAYLTQLREATERDLETEGFQKSRMKILAGITRLRQLCCHPALFLENYGGGSGKLDELLGIVQESREAGRRLLVFSQFASMLKLIRERLVETGLKPLYLDGSTPSGERLELCHRFNEGEGDVFLISLKAGGTGLNLTGADTVILYDLWWNPAVEEQAIGRAHRMGQKKVVQVIRLVAEGTIEEKIMELQERKKDLIEEVIEAGAGSATRLSEEDIRELLKM